MAMVVAVSAGTAGRRRPKWAVVVVIVVVPLAARLVVAVWAGHVGGRVVADCEMAILVAVRVCTTARWRCHY